MPDNNEPTDIEVLFVPKPQELEEATPAAEEPAKPPPEPEDSPFMRVPVGGRGRQIRVVLRTGDMPAEKDLDKIPANPLPKYKERKRPTQGTGMLDKAVDLLNAAFEEASALPPREKNEFLQRLRGGGNSLNILPEKGAFDPYPSGGDALAWLDTHWGDYLKHFRADRNYLSQNQLRRLDPKLMVALDNQVRYRNRKGTLTETVREIIPAKSERLDTEVDNISPKERKDLLRKLIAEFVAQAEDTRTNRKTYRKRDELPDPTQSHRAEKNLTKQQTKLRLEPDLLTKVNEAAKQAGLPRNTYLETAIRAILG